MKYKQNKKAKNYLKMNKKYIQEDRLNIFQINRKIDC